MLFLIILFSTILFLMTCTILHHYESACGWVLNLQLAYIFCGSSSAARIVIVVKDGRLGCSRNPSFIHLCLNTFSHLRSLLGRHNKHGRFARAHTQRLRTAFFLLQEQHGAIVNTVNYCSSQLIHQTFSLNLAEWDAAELYKECGKVTGTVNRSARIVAKSCQQGMWQRMEELLLFYYYYLYFTIKYTVKVCTGWKPHRHRVNSVFVARFKTSKKDYNY